MGSDVGYASCFQGDRSHYSISKEVSRALCEELPDIIGHVTDRLVARFEGRILAVQAVDEIVEVTQEHEIGLDKKLGKKKQTHGPTRQSEQFDVSMASVREPRGRDVCTRDEAAHEHVCGKSKCSRCGWKG